jgi:6-phosphogluconolactonase (cycloisomerase 2 family)
MKIKPMALVIAVACAALGGCGGGSSSTPSSSQNTGGNTGGGNTATYAVGGTVTGLLQNETLMLLNNNGDALTVSANGGFTFPTALAAGSAYSVTVGTQPAGASCSVSAGSGTATAAVSNVAVTCSPVQMKNIALFLQGATGTLLPFGYDVATGSLSALPAAPKGPGQTATAVVVDASVTHAYTLGLASDGTTTQISAFTIGAGGKISTNGVPLNLPGQAVSLALDKSGQYLYSLGRPNSSISSRIDSFQVNASTGQLGRLTTYYMPTGNTLTKLYANPTAEVVYALDPGANPASTNGSIATLSIGTTGNVNSSGPAVATGKTPQAMAMTSNGNYAYVVNAQDATVSVYTAATDGTLSAATPATVTLAPTPTASASPSPASIAIDASNGYLYVGDVANNLIYQFKINPTTGALTPLPAPTLATSVSPQLLSIVGDATSGAVLYATASANGAVSAMSINATTGQLATPKLASATVDGGAALIDAAFGR